ncbi:MAG: protein-L-isoaspartate(D-aspartate) O-methyltransferase [Deltaproteobacteria bacterium]|nr:protein-L-isoaspartate(D-aspartate) O-methyltransferase [Deltaproteobacteria bacterium]
MRSAPDPAVAETPTPVRRLCVFCGSSRGARSDYTTAAEELAAELARRSSFRRRWGNNAGVKIELEALTGKGAAERAVEVVERKGIGHPDTICDSLAEQFSLALSRAYRERAGRVLHHNVDKVLLVGGQSRTRFGGGEVTAPIEIFLSGRAVSRVGDSEIPLEQIAEQTSRTWLNATLHAFDSAAHVRIHTLVRPGSADLQSLFARGAGAAPLANDTSIGVGYSPLSPVERLVLDLDGEMRAPQWRAAHPEHGEDTKILAIRCRRALQLTVACAFVDRFLADAGAYRRSKEMLREHLLELARARFDGQVEVGVNVADGDSDDSLYLTVTGTSAEAGDDGEAGRGNRANGLITPSRPMTMESLAGKNPITHVGKLYNLAAFLLADDLVRSVPAISQAQCLLASRIGHPITDPAVAALRVRVAGGNLACVRADAEAICRRNLAQLDRLWEQLLDGTLTFGTWPLVRPAKVAPSSRLRLGARSYERERLALISRIQAEVRDTASYTGKKTLDARVLDAIATVPRHEFVPADERSSAYVNAPLPIGYAQTISQPYIVALMTDLLALAPESVVLEVGTGSGYQAAVLAELAARVYSIEIVAPLAERAAATLSRLGYDNVEVRAGDGHQGWPEHAPYDAIIVTAAGRAIPPALIEQLAVGGRLVAPVESGRGIQVLVVLTKNDDGRVDERAVLPVSFVPLTRQEDQRR